VAVARGAALCGAAVGGVGGGYRPPPPVGERARSRGGLLGGSLYFTRFLAGSHAASTVSKYYHMYKVPTILLLVIRRKTKVPHQFVAIRQNPD
jgi:hypothetical protein